MILDRTLRSASVIKLNIHLVQGESFDYTIIRYSNIERRKRFDFQGWKAKLVIFDEIYPNKIYHTADLSNNGIILYDGEIRIFIPSEVTRTFNFDKAEFRLTLIDNLGHEEIFIKGDVFLELGMNPCQQE